MLVSVKLGQEEQEKRVENMTKLPIKNSWRRQYVLCPFGEILGFTLQRILWPHATWDPPLSIPPSQALSIPSACRQGSPLPPDPFHPLPSLSLSSGINRRSSIMNKWCYHLSSRINSALKALATQSPFQLNVLPTLKHIFTFPENPSKSNIQCSSALHVTKINVIAPRDFPKSITNLANYFEPSNPMDKRLQIWQTTKICLNSLI